MKLELTDQQEQVVKQGHPVEVVDMASNRAFVIVTRELYEEFRAVLEKVGCMAENGEAIVADGDHAYSVKQMAEAWNAISRPLTQAEVALSVDPDEYPLF